MNQGNRLMWNKMNWMVKLEYDSSQLSAVCLFGRLVTSFFGSLLEEKMHIGQLIWFRCARSVWTDVVWTHDDVCVHYVSMRQLVVGSEKWNSHGLVELEQWLRALCGRAVVRKDRSLVSRIERCCDCLAVVLLNRLLHEIWKALCCLGSPWERSTARNSSAISVAMSRSWVWFSTRDISYAAESTHTLQIELQQSIFLLEELDDVANLDVWHDLAEVLHILTDMSLVFEADRPAAQAAKATPAWLCHHVEVSWNGGTPAWMVYNGKSF